MSTHRMIETFRFDIPRKFAYRLLGIRKKGRRPRESVMAMIDEEFSLASQMIDAKAVMVMSHAGLPGSVFIDSSLPLVVGVCTIGPALEERVATLMESGDQARAVILDAIGSAAAEETANRSNLLICEMSSPTDFQPDHRISPGYGKWNIREQEAIFRFVEPDDIGVTLNGSFMMTPRKSVSYVVPLEGGKPGKGQGSRCSHCNMADCPLRDDGGDDY
jgi:hypothetical protein